ncbi:XRE family transcriptional regulator [Oceanicola sp. 22II-s10i]|uniref:helix-turn-helix domain-containing protein n=1 Tax=Oceanicola sp. 22II-s10i TaxID=1317116 RepID=UPI000B527940|nr:helix-turn-helix transcriptional regulator [Oceanicola sp. 22II-s10i]OWU85089.1 XRE family transcriptional regulator [Oceanicola sp. 22II-s10i]
MTDEMDAGWFDPETSTFGDRIAGAREAAGLSQSELSRRLGIRLTTLRGWEDDLNEPRANKLQMMAGLLNVSLTWLLTGEGDGVTGFAAEPEDREVAAILTEMRDMRGQMTQMAEKIGRLEKRLRRAVREEA